jgi:hypothetical protein
MTLKNKNNSDLRYEFYLRMQLAVDRRRQKLFVLSMNFTSGDGDNILCDTQLFRSIMLANIENYFRRK